MKFSRLMWIGGALPFCLAWTAQAAEAPLGGEARFNKTCSKCHARGLNGAPRLGDKAVWTPLLQQGQEALTARAWVGIGDMPARGGNSDLALDEFARTVVYMARQSGAKWKDPTVQSLARIEAEAAKLPPPQPK